MFNFKDEIKAMCESEAGLKMLASMILNADKHSVDKSLVKSAFDYVNDYEATEFSQYLNILKRFTVNDYELQQLSKISRFFRGQGIGEVETTLLYRVDAALSAAYPCGEESVKKMDLPGMNVLLRRIRMVKQVSSR